MTVWELFIAAVCLSMDAFAVSVCKGLSIRKTKAKHCLTAGLYFGIFQALMPLAGYLLASTVAARISGCSHYIAFILLALIGANMIREAIKGDEENRDSAMDFRTMLPLAVATSIDAFAVGVSYALDKRQDRSRRAFHRRNNFFNLGSRSQSRQASSAEN